MLTSRLTVADLAHELVSRNAVVVTPAQHCQQAASKAARRRIRLPAVVLEHTCAVGPAPRGTARQARGVESAAVTQRPAMRQTNPVVRKTIGQATNIHHVTKQACRGT